MAMPPDDRRDQILDTAAAVWGERGVARVRVADIATRLGVSVGLIPYHFGSKDDVIAATFERIAEQDLVRVTEASDTTPAARIAHILEPSWPTIRPGACGSTPTGRRSTSRHCTARCWSRRKAWLATFEREIRRGVDEGAWACASPCDSATKIISYVDGLGVHVSLGMLGNRPCAGARVGAQFVADELGGAGR